MTAARGSTADLIAYYSAVAEAYEQRWANQLHELNLRLIEELPLGSARRVLDVGAGVGKLLPALATRAPNAVVLGVDRAEGMLRRAPRETWRFVADATALPFATGSFDVVVLAFVLFHLDDPIAGMRAVHRVICPNGTVGVNTWGRDTPSRARQIWLDELDRFGAPPDAEFVSQREVLNTPEKLAGLLDDAGFHRARVELRPWARSPRLEDFIAEYSVLGLGGRRLAALELGARNDFLRSARSRLATLDPDDFTHRAEVITATASAG